MANKSPYQQPLNDLYAVYHSSREGLSTAQSNQNREQFGKNQLAQKKKKPVWMIFLEQFKDFLVIILIIAAIISAITGELESTIVILVVITMNAILGTVQTVKAEKSLDNLKSLSAPHAKVLRDGTTVLLPAAELVVGDVILLVEPRLAANKDRTGQLHLPPWSGLHDTGRQKERRDGTAGAVCAQRRCL